MDLKLLEFAKTSPLTGKRQNTQNKDQWQTDFVAARDTTAFIGTTTRKSIFVNETSPAILSGVNSLFPWRSYNGHGILTSNMGD